MKSLNHHKVTLVGAGPGDAELLTLKALRAIQAADIVVYDRLVSYEIMVLIPAGVPKIYAGKSCKIKAMPQEEINDLLVMLAGKYRHVVRLKGGDPFMFGRGGEEALALQEKNITCEIIPGITSAQGCAAAAGIPLTHRGLATSVRFITGHRQPAPTPTLPLEGEGGERQRAGGGELELNWQSLADSDTTIVVYMGLTNIETIVAQLIAHGLLANTPVAIIERGTTMQQRVYRSNLSALLHVIDEEKIESPSLIIIGKVAALDVTSAVSEQPQSQTSARL